MNQQGSDANERRYYAQVRAFFSAFVAGDDFDDDDMLKAMSEGRDGIWEFRITFVPQARVFGGFLRTGEFVALNFDKRSNLAARGFAPLITATKARWKALFPSESPLLSGRSLLLQEFEDDI
ncbi:hypothetical protein AC629_13620 [Bradyrhizobium sp. NAS80.1]|uniref:hypothetical protein n=1 Tax=Bradyrhizobium sp. NAS80.1 TaxID=1680159 RepID=UPI00095A6D13|nr:hypothetical protein [Bradyrhizobium sp. NAS80.1]OKO87573.1 hypothetical protein AC629_13620 [Bradyrhizobium sp. NAS80.1]